MPLAPYFTGDAVPVEFTVTDANGAVNPSAATVTVLKPDKTLVASANATVNANTVTYTIPGSVTDQVGVYKAYFICTLTSGERTHKVEFEVFSTA